MCITDVTVMLINDRSDLDYLTSKSVIKDGRNMIVSMDNVCS